MNDQRQESPEEPLKTASDEMTKASLSNGLDSSSSRSLQAEKDIADSTILEQFAADKTNFVENTKLPKWLYKYLLFRFNLLDRTGDGVIDHEEFEYVLSEFGVSERVARQAFTIFTQVSSYFTYATWFFVDKADIVRWHNFFGTVLLYLRNLRNGGDFRSKSIPP